MDGTELTPEEECGVLLDEIALWERQQIEVANELQRLRQRLQEVRRRLQREPSVADG